jgi:hypothetical protein
LEHVQEALVDMRDHLLRLTEFQDPPGLEGIFDTTFKTLWEAHLDKYKMASQTKTNLAVAGGPRTATTAGQPSSYSELRQETSVCLYLPEAEFPATSIRIRA